MTTADLRTFVAAVIQETPVELKHDGLGGLCIKKASAAELSRVVLDAMTNTIRNSLLDGVPVAILNIGTLTPYVRKARNVRLPHAAKLRRVPDRKHVRLVESRTLKDALQKRRRAKKRKTR